MKLVYPNTTSNQMAMAFSTGDNETDFNLQDDPEEFDMIWDTMQRELNYADEREEQKDKSRFTLHLDHRPQTIPMKTSVKPLLEQNARPGQNRQATKRET